MNQAREDWLLQIFKRFRIPKETGNADEEIPIQGIEFTGFFLKVHAILFQAANIAQRDSPQDAAAYRGLPVKGKIDTRRIAEEREDRVELMISFHARSPRSRVFVFCDTGVTAQAWLTLRRSPQATV